MRARLMLTILVATALAGCSSDAPQEPMPTGRIDGAVLDHLMQPYGNVSVRLLELDQTTRTTDLGGFSFVHLEPGYYTLEVTLQGGMDRELVIVEDNITRIILQVPRAEEDEPTVSIRSHPEIVQLAMPGEHCEGCEWKTALRNEKPVAVEAVVTWDGHHPLVSDAETYLDVELRDGAGTLIAGPFGKDRTVRGDSYSLYFVIDGRDIPQDASSLALHFHFDQDNDLPHPDFEMESFLFLHYGASELTDALLA